MSNPLFKDYQDIPEKILNELDELIKEYKIKKEDIAKILKRLKKEYEDSKISPGEAIGIITAESFGEPGTQMSLSSEEKLIIKIKNKIRIVEIGNFIDELMKENNSVLFNNSEIADISDLDIYTPSIDQDGKMQWKKVVECSRHKTQKDLMKLITKSGRGIVATDNHSFVTRKNNKIVPIDGRSLIEGDRIPVVQNLPLENPTAQINVCEYLDIPSQEIAINNGMLCKLKCKKQIKAELQLNSLTGWFIGAYLAEGFANYGQISISNIDDDYIKNAKDFILGVGLDFVDKKCAGEFGASRSLYTSSTLLSRFVVNTCGTGSSKKRVPDFAFNTSKEFVSGLLRGYFDGDGNVNVKRKMIRCSSNSNELIKGISLLLTRFGIFSFKIKDKKGQSWLLIPYKYAPLFLKHIGSDIKKKKEALVNLSKLSEAYWKDKPQDYNDMISGFGDLFYRTAKKLNYPTRYINNFTKRQKIGRTALFKYINLFEELSKEKNVDINEELKIMKRMFDSDVVWDEIVKIEYIKNKNYVYDLSVPGLETFTTFDGIITHNTLNVFHFAGVAEVAVTTGLPRLIELFDARKTQSTPRTEVYLKRGIGTDDDKVKKIAALIKEVKLEDISEEFSFNLTMFRIDVKLNRKRIKDFKVKDSMIIDILTRKIKGINIKIDKDILKIKLNDSKENSLSSLFQIKEKCKNIVISGIKGFKQVTPVKRDNEFIILGTSSNLKDVLEVEGVDEKRTITNNPFIVAEIFGIEAARNVIMKEAVEVIKDQGLDIDIRHIMFLADVMTTSGFIKGITRSGITSEKESVLARASFETPIKHLVNASLIGEEDNLNSIIENVMLNQSVPIGTGLPDLVAKMKDEVKEKKQI